MTINANLPMWELESLEFHNGLCTFRPRGSYCLVEAVDLVSGAIANCREQGVGMLLVDATGLVDLAVPTLVDRFLMMAEWAREAEGKVIVAMVVPAEYVHPRKVGVKFAEQLGLICDVYSSEEEAAAWLRCRALNFALAGSVLPKKMQERTSRAKRGQ